MSCQLQQSRSCKPSIRAQKKRRPPIMRSSLLCVLALSVCAAPAFAAVTVNSPSPNTTVGNPFVLTATASPCSSQPVASMGYSLDAGATTVVNAASINAQVAAPTGNHTLHVKSWGNQGASCSTDVPIMVSSSVAATPFTDVSVSQPTGAFKLVSPFAIVASGTQCKSQPITAMGYSIDDSSNTTIMNGGALNGQVTSPTGRSAHAARQSLEQPGRFLCERRSHQRGSLAHFDLALFRYRGEWDPHSHQLGG